MTATPDTLTRIAELDAILSEARRAWLDAPTLAAKRKARKQIDDALDMRLDLMRERDEQQPA